MAEEFTSSLVAEVRSNGGVLTRGDITVKLAEHYGFCWGVERAVSKDDVVNMIICYENMGNGYEYGYG